MTTIVDFSEWLRMELERREWKPTELARRAELDDGIISRALSGARVPSTKSLEKIADALDISIDIVYRAAGLLPPVQKTDEWASTIYRRIERLPPQLRDIAESFIDMLYEKEQQEKRKK